MSRLRENVTVVEGELASPAEGDLAPYVIFTQLLREGPYVYAGWLDAADDEMAIQFAREHYGRDQKCLGIWAVPRDALAGTDVPPAATADEGPRRTFRVFTQTQRGDPYVSSGTVEAAGSGEALRLAAGAVASQGPVHGIWVAPADRIASTGAGEVIWPLSDQSYRLARGYSAAVRAKWEKIRRERDLREYEADDLKEVF
jgi:ring-1,2-phenylacetyl-CoA epoxidase subunit PaaB